MQQYNMYVCILENKQWTIMLLTLDSDDAMLGNPSELIVCTYVQSSLNTTQQKTTKTVLLAKQSFLPNGITVQCR